MERKRLMSGAATLRKTRVARRGETDGLATDVIRKNKAR